MEKNKIKELIIQHKENFLSKKDLIKREIQKNLNGYIKHKEIIIITGIRRSGKSSLMKLICNDLIEKYNVPISNILYLNFEDERFVDFTINDFASLYEIFIEIENPSQKKYFFLDEIQNIKGWEKWVNRLYEFEDIKFFITGSNSSIISSDISTALTGRNRQLVNLPFSFREFLTMKECNIDDKSFYKTEKRAEIKRLFKEYFHLGGFPEVIKINDTTLLQQYFKDIIYRDVITRYSIRNVKEIKELTLFIASNISTIQSYQNIKNFIGVKSINTIKNYLNALNDIYLFFFIDMFDYSIKRQIYNPSKIYCIDIALSNAISFKFSQNLGHLYENLVFIELLRNNKEIYYWKSKKGYEIDFVTKKGLKLDQAIQVVISLSNKKTKDRELNALKAAKEELNLSNMIIITEDEEGEEMIDDTCIKIIPAWKWILQR